MDFLAGPPELMAVASAVFMLLLSSNRVLDVDGPHDIKDESENSLQSLSEAS